MMVLIEKVILVLFVVIVTTDIAITKKSDKVITEEDLKKSLPLINCAVCRSMIDEVNYTISQIDDKKMVEIGGGRKVPFARSDIHLNEIFDNLCEKKFARYALSKNKDGKQSIIRTYSRNGIMDIDNIDLSADGQRAIQSACKKLVEEYEENLIHIFKTQRPKEELENKICIGMTKFCRPADIGDPIPTPEGKKVHDEL